MKTTLAALAASVLFATAASADAPPDTWVRWISNSPDHTVRSLDFLGPTLFGSSDSGGVFASESGTFATWSQKNGGLPDATSQNVHQVQLSGFDGLLYAATSAGLFSSPPPGDGWQPVGNGVGPRKLNMGGVQSIVFNAPGDMTVAVAGAPGPGIYNSSDQGQNWDKASGMPAGENIYYITRGAPGTLWGAGDSGVWFSPNAGRNWVALSDGISPGETTLRVAFVDGQHLYASTSSTVYRTDDGGFTWEEADGADDQLLPAGGKRAFLMTPTMNGQFGDNRGIVGTEGGPWVTVDKGDHWLPMSDSTAPDLYNDGDQNVRNTVIWALGLGFTQPGLVAGNGFGVFHLPLWPVDAESVTVSPNSGLKPGSLLKATVNGLEGTKPYFIKYQWLRCDGAGCTPDEPIQGATQSEYVVPDDDANHPNLRFAVRANVINLVRPNPLELNSTPTTGGVAATPAQMPRPVFSPSSDQPQLSPEESGPWDRELTIAKGKWRTEGSATDVTDDLTYVYRWERCFGSNCESIDGKTGPTYTLKEEDIGGTVSGYVRGVTDTNLSSAYFLAGTTQTVQNKFPVNTTPPKILGDPYTGVVLSSSAGGWDGFDMRWERRWLRCNAEGVQCNPTNPVQTTSTYELTAADKGSTLQLEVKAIAEDPSQDRVTTTYSALTPVIGDPPPPAPTPGPSPSPTPTPGGGVVKPAIKIKKPKKVKVGAKLSVPKRFAGFTKPKYQWLRNGKKIKKATKRVYKIKKKDRGKKLSCRITLTPAAGGKKVVVKTKAVKVPKKKKR